MKKDIIVIAHFTDDFESGGNNRFNYLMELLDNEKMKAELITSDFSHFKKNKKNVEDLNIPYKVTFISEPRYHKNVSLKRFLSHYIFSQNVKKYLKQRKIPDVIYCAVPTLSVAKIAAEYAKKNNIKFIIDIQDLWPEAFKMVFDIPIISNVFFRPIEKIADNIYSSADEIIAVSDTYLNRALSVNFKNNHGHNIFLGTELKKFDELASENEIKKNKNEIWLAYIGTLGHSYDIMTVIDAINILYNQGIDNIRFIIMGDGPLKNKFEQYAKQQKINVTFTGRLDYGKMVGILNSCDFAVNPIHSKSAGSIINKVGDYAAAGLPVINTQENEEYQQLLIKYNAGINCINNNPYDMAEKISLLYKDKYQCIELGKNSRRLAEEKFDRQNTYKKIIKLL